jgi:hypothetical protein
MAKGQVYLRARIGVVGDVCKVVDQGSVDLFEFPVRRAMLIEWGMQELQLNVRNELQRIWEKESALHCNTDNTSNTKQGGKGTASVVRLRKSEETKMKHLKKDKISRPQCLPGDKRTDRTRQLTCTRHQEAAARTGRPSGRSGSGRCSSQ